MVVGPTLIMKMAATPVIMKAFPSISSLVKGALSDPASCTRCRKQTTPQTKAIDSIRLLISQMPDVSLEKLKTMLNIPVARKFVFWVGQPATKVIR